MGTAISITFSLIPWIAFLLLIIGYGLPEESRVTLRVYNIRGQVVRTLAKNESQEPGYYRMTWDGTNEYGQALASGMYIVRIQTKAFTKIRKMVLIR